MKPLWITLLVTPLILIVVAAVYLWWQRASMVPATRRRVLAWRLAVSLVLGFLGTWYFFSIASNSYFDIWMLVSLGCLVCGIIGDTRRLWNEYKH
jgi:hypothetical protein